MTHEEDIIRNAWFNRPMWNFSDGPLRVPGLPLNIPVTFDPDKPLRQPYVRPKMVEFRHEYGTLNGRPASRIIGKLRDTEIIVNEAYK